ncbi:MAG: phosphoglucosamine mutase [Coriobacteriia bacterium]|nr:phosphoglucosamine mutase [Coriobacteriia bacterium]
MARLFGTDGVRGIANSELSPELALKLGEAAGRFLAGSARGRIVVGRDTRLSGDMLEAALVAGICSAGSDALVAGVVPTPAVALLVRELGADGGVVISASHNPPEFNGIKFFDRQGFKLADAVEDEIEAFCVAERDWAHPTGSAVGRVLRVEDAVERYIAHSIATVEGDLVGLVIAVDCGHGASSGITPEALRRLGATVIALNCESDGFDINVGCGSTHLAPLAELVVREGADLGIAHDGDADRMLAIDETGAEVDGDMIMAICAAHLREGGRLSLDAVVSTVMCNLGFEIAMRERGIRVIKTAVGDRYVLEQMRDSGATLGGEQSGHVIFLEHNTTGDGLVTALKLASVLHVTGKPLSELKQVMRRYPQTLVNVRVGDKGGFSANVRIAEAILKAEDALGDTGRVLVRASGTEPLVRVMIEAADEATARELAEDIAQVVRAEIG